MIPITEQTIAAIAALIYNHAYKQDPDTGWLAGDEQSAPAHAPQWLEWSAQLLQTLQEQPDAEDSQLLTLAKQRVDRRKVGHDWDIIPMDQEHFSTIPHETDVVMDIVRDFLAHPDHSTEVCFLEKEPAYLTYLEAPLSEAHAG